MPSTEGDTVSYIPLTNEEGKIIFTMILANEDTVVGTDLKKQPA